jgi:hypothetical protein
MKMSSSILLKISATMSKTLKTQRSISPENQTSTLEMPSISSTLIEVEVFQLPNFMLDSTLLVYMPLMKKLIFSLPDTMVLEIEDCKPENSNKLSSPTMLMLTPKLPEDHLTIPQDQL